MQKNAQIDLRKFNLMCQLNNLVVRPASSIDLNDIVDVHLSTFKGFFLPDLGKKFLYKYYSYILDYNSKVLLIAISESKTVGFAAGFVNPANFYEELRRNKLSLAISILPAILRKPKRIRRLLVNFKLTKSFSEEHQLKKNIAELSSICVKPGEKRGIGTELVNAFIQRAKELGAISVRLTTDTYKNEAVNAFYQRQGFILMRTFEAQPGRWLNEYEKLI